MTHNTEKVKVSILVSGNGSNLQAIIDAVKKDAAHPIDIISVISNKPDVYALERAKNHNIKTHVVPHGDYESREAFDQAIHQTLLEDKIEYICLAGFMRILTEGFVNKWPGRIINVHPSLLPEFKGANAIKQAFEAGVNETGCSIHVVTPEMDDGPVIGQAIVKIEESDTLETLTEKMHKAEHQLYPQILRRFIEERD